MLFKCSFNAIALINIKNNIFLNKFLVYYFKYKLKFKTFKYKILIVIFKK